MDAFQLVQLRDGTTANLNLANSNTRVLFILHDYFNTILAEENELFISSFILEFIEAYIFSLRNYDPFYKDISLSKSILNQVKQLIKSPPLNEFKNELEECFRILNDKINHLQSTLDGKVPDQNQNNQIYFPVIESPDFPNKMSIYGFAETASITIKNLHNGTKNSFVIIPSLEKIEEKILNQIEISWKLALSYAKRYLNKINKFHEVIIQFNNRSGEYVGESLGAALTILFLRELLKFYNSPYRITPNTKIAITGGLSFDGSIHSVSEKIIRQKTEIIFYSDISIFVVPNGEEVFVRSSLDILKQNYPAREIKIIEAKTFDDIYNRRDLISIKKEKMIVRSSKFVLRNWIVFTLILLLASISFLYVYSDIDDNPYIIEANGNTALIKNKSGKILWEKNVAWPPSLINQRSIRQYVRVLDINGDGKNEVLLCQQVDKELRNLITSSAIICYDSKGENIIWSYVFSDTVKSKRETLLPPYYLCLIDTFSINGIKQISLFGKNSDSFTSPIFCLILKTGKRIGGTLWCSGHNEAAIIKDINNDGIPDLVAAGIDNGFEQLMFYGISINRLYGYRPTTDQYRILNQPSANLLFCIKFPKTDYTEYLKFRTEGIYAGGVQYYPNERSFHINTFMGDVINFTSFDYRVSNNLKDVNVVIGSTFRVRRDSLVAHHILSPPYTDTQEYKNLLISKILYWQDNKWVKKEELK